MDAALLASVCLAGAIATPAIARTIDIDREKAREILCRTGVKLVPEGERTVLGRKLVEAGVYSVNADWFAGLRLALAGGFALACLPLLFFGLDLFWVILLSPLLYAIPGFWLNSRISRRKSRIRFQLADFSVLFSTALAAGADILLALEETAKSIGGPLAEEVNRTLKECRTNKSITEALTEMADRCNVNELRDLVQAVMHSYRYGTPLADSMRNFAERMRSVRRYEAMEAASKLSVMLVVPVLVFILFPSMLVLFYPAAVQLMRAFGM